MTFVHCYRFELSDDLSRAELYIANENLCVCYRSVSIPNALFVFLIISYVFIHFWVKKRRKKHTKVSFCLHAVIHLLQNVIMENTNSKMLKRSEKKKKKRINEVTGRLKWQCTNESARESFSNLIKELHLQSQQMGVCVYVCLCRCIIIH